MKTLDVPKRIELEVGQYELVNGQFSPDECLEILTHLVQEKINFHNKKSLTRVLQHGLEDKTSLNRIEELKATREEIKQVITKAREEGKTMSIRANIAIELI